MGPMEKWQTAYKVSLILLCMVPIFVVVEQNETLVSPVTLFLPLLFVAAAITLLVADYMRHRLAKGTVSTRTTRLSRIFGIMIALGVLIGASALSVIAFLLVRSIETSSPDVLLQSVASLVLLLGIGGLLYMIGLIGLLVTRLMLWHTERNNNTQAHL